MQIKGWVILGFVMLACSCKQGGSNRIAEKSDSAKNLTDSLTITKKPNLSADTLTYTFATIKMRASNCGDKPDSACSFASIKYPVFNGSPSLNDSIKHRFLNLFFGEHAKKDDTAVNAYARTFINSYERVKNDTKRDPQGNYTLDCSAQVLRQAPDLIIIQFSGSMYNGAAHGIDGCSVINWNPRKSRIIQLNDIFNTGYLKGLTKIAEQNFRTQEHLSDTASLSDYLFADGRFGLAKNFRITPNGITFLYNEYEAKPYSEGPVEVPVTYSQIKSLLKPNTVVSQYIKHAGI
jgi:hypothetical protein